MDCLWCPNRASTFADVCFGRDQSRAQLIEGSLLSFKGWIVQLLERSHTCTRDVLTRLSVRFLMRTLFLTAHLMGLSTEFASMESIRNSTTQIHWKFHGIHMDQSMDCIWKVPFHRCSIWIP